MSSEPLANMTISSSAPSTPIGQRITPTTPQAPGRRGPPTLNIPAFEEENLFFNNIPRFPRIPRERMNMGALLNNNNNNNNNTNNNSNKNTIVGEAEEITINNLNNNVNKSSGNKRKYSNISTRKAKRGGKRKSIKRRKSMKRK
jgi:hypothetical protein